jgi:hypothetical protein
MTAQQDTTPATERITLDQIKHRAEAVKDLAVSDAKATVSAALDTDATRTLFMIAGIVVVAASMAFYLGSHSRPTITPEP